jgi:hypothetical protein
MSIINNSYRINVYRFRSFLLDKSTVTCLFLIHSYLDELLRSGTTFLCNQCKQYGGLRRETTMVSDWKQDILHRDT